LIFIFDGEVIFGVREYGIFCVPPCRCICRGHGKESRILAPLYVLGALKHAPPVRTVPVMINTWFVWTTSGWKGAGYCSANVLEFNWEVKVKVKQSCYRPGMAQRIPGN